MSTGMSTGIIMKWTNLLVFQITLMTYMRRPEYRWRSNVDTIDNIRFPELLALVDASRDAFIRWAKLNSEVERVASKQLYELFIHMDSGMLTTPTVALAGGELVANLQCQSQLRGYMTIIYQLSHLNETQSSRSIPSRSLDTSCKRIWFFSWRGHDHEIAMHKPDCPVIIVCGLKTQKCLPTIIPQILSMYRMNLTIPSTHNLESTLLSQTSTW